MTPPPHIKLTNHTLKPQCSPSPTFHPSYSSLISPPLLQTTEDDSGFESLNTNGSDTGSLSSRLIAISPGEKDHSSTGLGKISADKDEVSVLTSLLTPLSRRQFNNINSSGRRSVAQS